MNKFCLMALCISLFIVQLSSVYALVNFDFILQDEIVTAAILIFSKIAFYCLLEKGVK